jgi:hypothetical protein
MRKFFLTLSMMAMIFILTSVPSLALTLLSLDPTNQVFDIGDSLGLDIIADIDTEDAILGFGFDLSFDDGASFVSGPGASGNALTFDSFSPNSLLGFNYDPFFDSDGDTISGILGFLDPDVSGTAITLGTFSFTAFALNPESILLSADDVGTPFSGEGLIPGFTSTSFISFLPNEPSATASPVPEPATIMLLASGIAGLGVFGRRKFRNKKA